ncbi:MAG: VanW family protein [Pseudonocardia sp.]
MPDRHETPGELTQPFSAYDADEATAADHSSRADEPVAVQPRQPEPQPASPAMSAVEAVSTSSPWFSAWDASCTMVDSVSTQVFERQPNGTGQPQGTAGNGTAGNGTASNGTAAPRPAPVIHQQPQPQVSPEQDELPAVEPQPELDSEQTQAYAAVALPPEVEAPTQPSAPADQRLEATTTGVEAVPTEGPAPQPAPQAAASQVAPAAQPLPPLPAPTAPPYQPQPASPQPPEVAAPAASAVAPPPPEPPEPADPAATRERSMAAKPSGSPMEWPTAVVHTVQPDSAWGAPAPETYGAETYGAETHPPQAPPAQAYAPPPPAFGPPTDGSNDDEPPADRSPRRKRRVLIVAAVLGVLAMLYVVDLVLSQGAVPRGVTVAGVNVGGMNPAETEILLRSTIQSRTTQPIPVRAGEVQATIDPRTTGLQVNWDRTLKNVNAQPLNPWTRFITLFSDRRVGVATIGDPNTLAGAITQLVPTVDRPPIEGNVRFQGTKPLPVEPKAGLRLDQATAADVLRREWVSGVPVILPMLEDQPTTTSESVKLAIEQVATPAVSAPFTIAGEKSKEASIAPTVIASALHFVPDGSGGLRPDIEAARIEAAADAQLASTEQPVRDASLALQGGKPVVTPSVDGRGIDYEVTLKPLVDVLRRPTDRRLVATYGPQPAKLTTQDVNRLGITDVIGEFTTSGFAADSGLNIRRGAQAINGTILKPGETFSLNGTTGPRNAGSGYVEAGIIQDGHPARGVGGGVSQLATTTYNAAYFAGMTDVAHTEHSFYISRYPAAREATVFEGSIDLKFRNDNPTGVLIQTVWTPSSITVRIYGVKRYVVTSATGPRTNPTSPGEVTIPAGQPCSPSNGSGGFTTSDTRTMREISTGATKSNTRTVTYRPSPKVICGG